MRRDKRFCYKELRGGMLLTNDITGRDFVSLAIDMRDWDRKEGEVYDCEPDEVLPGRYLKLINERTNDLIGIWSSFPIGEGDNTRGWGWITTRHFDKYKFDLCRIAKECVYLWWGYEEPQVDIAFINVIEGHRQANEFIKRFVGSSLAVPEKDIFICGVRHNLWRFDRPVVREEEA